MPRGTERAILELTADPKKLDPGLREGRRRLRRFGSLVKGDLKRIGRGVAQIGGLGVVGALGVVGSEVRDFERSLVRLGIQASKSPARMAAFREEVQRISDDTGLARNELLGGAAAFVSLTGDFDGAASSLEVFARTAQASGASLEDIAGVAFSLKENFNLDPSQFEQALSIVLASGKAGSIELRDMAGLLTTVAPSFTRFGDQGTEALGRLASALQVMRSGFGGAAETVTGMNSLMAAMARNERKLRKFGVRTFTVGADGVRRMRDFRSIIEDLANSKLAKNDTLLIDALGRVEAVRAAQELVKNRERWDELTEASRGARDVAEDYAAFMESDAGKTDKAFNDIKGVIAKAITPELITDFAGAVRKFADAVAWLAKNPLKAIAGAAALRYGPSLLGLAFGGLGGRAAGAGVGALLGGAARGGLGSAIGGAASGGVLSRASSSLAGKAGLVGAAAAAGVALGTLADRALGLSDTIAGIEPGAESKINAARASGVLDPTGQAARLREQAKFGKAGAEAEADRLINERVAAIMRGEIGAGELAGKNTFLRSGGNTFGTAAFADEAVRKIARAAAEADRRQQRARNFDPFEQLFGGLRPSQLPVYVTVRVEDDRATARTAPR